MLLLWATDEEAQMLFREEFVDLRGTEEVGIAIPDA